MDKPSSSTGGWGSNLCLHYKQCNCVEQKVVGILALERNPAASRDNEQSLSIFQPIMAAAHDDTRHLVLVRQRQYTDIIWVLKDH